MGLICVGVKQAETFHPETLPGLSLESCKDDSLSQNLTKTSAEVLRHRCSFEEEAGPRSLERASEPQIGVTYPGVQRFQNSHKLQGPRDTYDVPLSQCSQVPIELLQEKQTHKHCFFVVRD